MPQDNNQNQMLDQDAVRLAKAIKNVESRDNPDAKGKSGEFGLYQWMPDTWKQTTAKYNLDPGDISRENQNKAAYMTIKELKDKGYTPDKIAAFWNSGKTDGWEEKRGVNKYGVKYDVPAYVAGVQKAYEQLKTSETGGMGVNTPSTIGHQQTAPAPENGALLKLPVQGKTGVGGLLTGLVKGAGDTLAGMSRTGDMVANQTAGRVVSAIEGKGFNPLPSSRVEDQNIVNSQKVKEALVPHGATEKTGFYGEKVGELAIPIGGGTKGLLNANKIARAGSEAIEIAGEKMTPTVAKSMLKSGDVPYKVKKGAEAITEYVKKGLLKVGDDAETAASNTKFIRGEIGKTADDLITRLRSMTVKPIAQPEDLANMLKTANEKAADSISHSPEKTKQIFDKFVSYLPKGREIDAADILDARKKLDAWINADKGGKIFDPVTENAVSNSLRAIRQGANDLAEHLAPDQAVKDSLAHQSALYDVLENIAAKGSKALQEADKLAKTRGIKGLLARHPIITKAAEYGLIGGVGGAAVKHFSGD